MFFNNLPNLENEGLCINLVFNEVLDNVRGFFTVVTSVGLFGKEILALLVEFID